MSFGRWIRGTLNAIYGAVSPPAVSGIDPAIQSASGALKSGGIRRAYIAMQFVLAPQASKMNKEQWEEFLKLANEAGEKCFQHNTDNPHAPISHTQEVWRALSAISKDDAFELKFRILNDLIDLLERHPDSPVISAESHSAENIIAFLHDNTPDSPLIERFQAYKAGLSARPQYSGHGDGPMPAVPTLFDGPDNAS